MPPIRRAAVTGLFALWLAPLGAMAESRSSTSRDDCRGEACSHVESYVAEDRHGRSGLTTKDARERQEEASRSRRDSNPRPPD